MTSGPKREDSTLAAILRRRSHRRIARVLVSLTLLLGGASLYWMRRAPAPIGPRPEAELELLPPPQIPSPPPAPEQIPPPPVPPEEQRPGPRAEPLPDLDGSDAFIRERVSSLSPHPQLEAWLEASDLARRFAVAIDNLAEGKTPARHWRALAPSAPFAAIRARIAPAGAEKQNPEEERYLIDPSSWARYDPLVDAFVSLDVARSVALYRRLEPLFDWAYRELGYPDGDFRSTLFQAIDELLRTPTGVGADEVPLRRKVLGYAYLDPELEALSPAQKQLLRTGPGNVPRVQRRLRQFTRALGAHSAELPTSPRYRARRGANETH